MAKKKRAPKPSASTSKGRIAEQIAAWLHERPGIGVERNVFLPTLDGSGRKREIDVVLTGDLAGYPLRMAVECKNEAHPIGVEKVDAFVAKLQDVGIAPQHGIYVSASGYTSGAVGRARTAGMRTVVLEGLTPDRLSAAVWEALQSVVYVLLNVTQVTLRGDIDPRDIGLSLGDPVPAPDLHSLWDEAGTYRGSTFDLVWERWQVGNPPSYLGAYRYRLDLPPGVSYVINGTAVAVIPEVTASVVGLVVTAPGQAEEFALRNAADGTVERTGGRMSFDDSPGAVFPVTTVRSEPELAALLADPPVPFRVTVGRLRLPRIDAMGVMYWPPSDRALRTVRQRYQELVDAGATDFSSLQELGGEALEGTDLLAIWDAIWPGHPAACAE